jgi:hypothetical protein
VPRGTKVPAQPIVQEVPTSNERMDVWLCTVCGAPAVYPRTRERHAGPPERLLDRRYARQACWRAWVNESGKPSHPAGEMTLWRHDSRPASPQPEQTDPTIVSLLNSSPTAFKDTGRTYGVMPGARRGHSRRSGESGLSTVVLFDARSGIAGRISAVPEQDVVPWPHSALVDISGQYLRDDWPPAASGQNDSDNSTQNSEAHDD